MLAVAVSLDTVVIPGRDHTPGPNRGENHYEESRHPHRHRPRPRRAAGGIALARIDATELGNRALLAASRSTGVQASAAHFELRLLEGLSIHEVSIRGHLAAGPYSGTVERIHLEHRILPLLLGRLSVAQLTLERPELEIRVRGGKPPAKSSGGTSRGGGGRTNRSPDKPEPDAIEEEALAELQVSIDTLTIHNGAISVRNPRQSESIQASGLELHLTHLARDPNAGAALEGLEATGTVAIERLATDRLELRDISGAFAADDGTLQLADLTATHEAGSIEVHELSADLALQRGSYHLVATLRDLDTAYLLSTPQHSGLGVAHLRIAGEGPLATPERLVAKGVLDLDPGRLPSLAALAEIDETLGSRLDESRYRATQIEFERLPAGHLDLKPFELVGDSFSIRAQGRLRADDTLGVSARIGLDPDQLDSVSLARDVVVALATDNDRTWIPVTISGPATDPRVRVNKKLLAEDMEETARSAAREGIEKVKEKFGDDIGEKLEQRLERELEALRER